MKFEREQRADQTLAYYFHLAANGSHVYVIDLGLLFKPKDESVHYLREKVLMLPSRPKYMKRICNWATISLEVRMLE